MIADPAAFVMRRRATYVIYFCIHLSLCLFLRACSNISLLRSNVAERLANVSISNEANGRTFVVHSPANAMRHGAKCHPFLHYHTPAPGSPTPKSYALASSLASSFLSSDLSSAFSSFPSSSSSISATIFSPRLAFALSSSPATLLSNSNLLCPSL